MIVLVWNVGASGRRFLFEDPSPLVPPPGFPNVAASPGASGSSLPAADCAALASNGNLTTIQRYLLGKRVDINTASAAEIGELPGLSDTVARAVVEARARLGGFQKAEDLLRVRGIKEKRLKKILPFLKKFPNN